ASCGRAGTAGVDLLAVDHEVVAVADGAGLERGQVRAGAGLAVALAPVHGGIEGARDALLLLGLRAVGDERRPEHHRPQPAEARGAVLGELLVEDELVERRHAGAAVLLGPAGGDPALLRERLAPALPGGGPVAGDAAAAAHHLVLRQVVALELVRELGLDEAADFLAPGGL